MSVFVCVRRRATRYAVLFALSLLPLSGCGVGHHRWEGARRDFEARSSSSGLHDNGGNQLSREDRLIEDIYEALDHGKFARALKKANLIVESAGNSADVWSVRSDVHLEMGNLDQALVDAQKAVELAPNRFELYHYLANVHAEREDYPACLREITRAIETGPAYFRHHLLRGYAYEQSGDYAEAAADYRRVIDLEPKNAWGWNNLAATCSTAADDSIRDGQLALQAAQKAVELCSSDDPDRYCCLNTLACAFAEVGQFQEAIKVQQEVIRLTPKKEQEEMQRHYLLLEKEMPIRHVPPRK